MRCDGWVYNIIFTVSCINIGFKSGRIVRWFVSVFENCSRKVIRVYYTHCIQPLMGRGFSSFEHTMTLLVVPLSAMAISFENSNISIFYVSRNERDENTLLKYFLSSTLSIIKFMSASKVKKFGKAIGTILNSFQSYFSDQHTQFYRWNYQIDRLSWQL